jgi:hypothetical protein
MPKCFLMSHYHDLIISSYYIEEVINLIFLIEHPDFSSTNDALDGVVYRKFIIINIVVTSIARLIAIFVFVFNFVFFVDIYVLGNKHGAELILIFFVPIIQY